MDKGHILAEIRRTAQGNGGIPLGTARFQTETGIRRADWYGKYWSRWGDAVREAGFSPNTKQEAYSDEYLLEKLVSLVCELGHYPVYGEFRMKSRQDRRFPNADTFRRLGDKPQLAARIVQYCEQHGGHDDVARICAPVNGR